MEGPVGPLFIHWAIGPLFPQFWATPFCHMRFESDSVTTSKRFQKWSAILDAIFGLQVSPSKILEDTIAERSERNSRRKVTWCSQAQYFHIMFATYEPRSSYAILLFFFREIFLLGKQSLQFGSSLVTYSELCFQCGKLWLKLGPWARAQAGFQKG